MKLGLISLVGIAAILSMGCAANPALQAKANALQTTVDQQDAEIKDLSARAAKCAAGHVANDLGEDAKVMASSVWDLFVQYASDAGKDISDKARSCYDDGKDRVHSWEDFRALAERCYDNKH